jgi:hypothetical protein
MKYCELRLGDLLIWELPGFSVLIVKVIKLYPRQFICGQCEDVQNGYCYSIHNDILSTFKPVIPHKKFA